MNCRYVQSRLSAYLDVELSGEEQQLIRSHLEQCLECSCEFESLRRTKQLLRQVPIVVSHSGPEQVLLRVRHATPAPRRAAILTWHVPRWWQFAGGLALVAAFTFWSQSDNSTSQTQGSTPLPSANFPSTSPIFSSAPSPELPSPYRPTSLFLMRRPVNPISEPVLMPSVSYSTDPMLGYSPISDWSGVVAEPKMVELPR